MLCKTSTKFSPILYYYFGRKRCMYIITCDSFEHVFKHCRDENRRDVGREFIGIYWTTDAFIGDNKHWLSL